MSDNVIDRVRDVIVRSWARPVAATAEEVVHERNMALIAALALQQSGLLNTNDPDAATDIVTGLAKGNGELQDRIAAALAVCDQYIPHQYGMYEAVAREVRAALTGEEEQ